MQAVTQPSVFRSAPKMPPLSHVLMRAADETGLGMAVVDASSASPVLIATNRALELLLGCEGASSDATRDEDILARLAEGTSREGSDTSAVPPRESDISGLFSRVTAARVSRQELNLGEQHRVEITCAASLFLDSHLRVYFVRAIES